ncbi:PhzF family phenazine biosynthesis protein [Luteibacter jiangsuensis]|uniref:PhzF family phenazine biosynthesis protein n=1 Tax=Luteibacter jiangsuensis TaxID=637577 RepID=A0ABX0Q522_9GAMM|nr:PhzF family phenazine biosynthesis protein [Luteibacter jiangsuensis]NID05618.1 PhzF family phenazine biosynthesis protein [Luteibacter jiangsuensis]
MTRHAFRQLDVFSDRPLGGNPLAVVFDADSLDDATMAALARWTQLSETVFLQSPSDPRADYRVRIFSPRGEMPFAGHPTLGACHAWLAAGGQPKATEIVQECGIGLVPIRRDGGVLSFRAPPLRSDAPLEAPLRERIASGLGLAVNDLVDARWVDNGAGWCAVLLREPGRLHRLSPDPVALDGLKIGVVANGGPAPDTAFEVRALVFAGGMLEDPATGSLNAGIAVWFAQAGLAPDRYVIAQGRALGRDARIHVAREGDALWIGGRVAECIEGRISLPGGVPVR